MYNKNLWIFLEYFKKHFWEFSDLNFIRDGICLNINKNNKLIKPQIIYSIRKLKRWIEWSYVWLWI